MPANKKYGVRHLARPDTWLICQPGGRLDRWGPATERAEYTTWESALVARFQEHAESFSEVVDLDEYPL
jgi:hypothetical protein